MPSLPQSGAARQSGIYQIRHVPSGRLYIGSTGQRGSRWRIHRWRLNAGNHHNARLQEDWSRDGAAEFVFEFLEAFADRDEMKRREREYVARLHPYYNAGQPVRKPRRHSPVPEIHVGACFGYWTVTGAGPNYPAGFKQRGQGNRRWYCRCDCQRERLVAESSLLKGASTSCGCSKRINTIASIMGRLIIQENGCCVWPGSRHDFGYGMVTFERKHWYVHRLLYEHFVGPVPEGLVLDHEYCDNPPCANWAHLKPCTSGENTLRGNSPLAKNGRKTHCKRGHELTGSNVHVGIQKGHYPMRICLICRAQVDHERYVRNKLARQKAEQP